MFNRETVRKEDLMREAAREQAKAERNAYPFTGVTQTETTYYPSGNGPVTVPSLEQHAASMGELLMNARTINSRASVLLATLVGGTGMAEAANAAQPETPRPAALLPRIGEIEYELRLELERLATTLDMLANNVVAS